MTKMRMLSDWVVAHPIYGMTGIGVYRRDPDTGAWFAPKVEDAERVINAGLRRHGMSERRLIGNDHDGYQFIVPVSD